MPVQLSDLLTPHLTGVEAVVQLSGPAVALPGELSARPPADDERFGPGTLVVLADAPVAEVAARLQAGARVLLLSTDAGDPVPLHLIGRSGTLQLLAASALEDADPDADTVAGAALLTCVEAHPGLPEVDPDDDEDVDVMSGAAATARYERAIAGRDRRIQSLEARISALESSATYVVGRTLVNAARNPRKAKTLPSDLWGMWKGRAGRSRKGGEAAPATAAPSRGLAARQVNELDDIDAGLLYLTHTAMAIGPRTVPVLAGILTADTAPALRGDVANPHAVVNTLLPHDGEGIVTRTDPDVVLIESAALGAPGPWAYTTQGAYGVRDKALVDIITAARAMGRPVVVWWNSPHYASPGLNRVATHADLVLTDAEPGPALVARLNAELDLGFDLPAERAVEENA
ncbi:hypothetical protein GCM10009547_22630 [Sporichthya brevicatena]|uniref:Uncharacterized protein n=1 Tax=Sporichthya brevicatena TaxID=171442 RepID=A0ABN1GU60_9ACTN